jgi:hypothetical protein
LQHLRLAECAVSDTVVRQVLEKSPSVTYLCFDGCDDITDGCLAGRLPRLNSLTLSRLPQLTEIFLEHLLQNPNDLLELKLSSLPAVCSPRVWLGNLRHLELANMKQFNPICLASWLEQCLKLRSLALLHMPDDLLEGLNAPHLESLTVAGGCGPCDRSLTWLCKSWTLGHPPPLIALNLSSVSASDEVLGRAIALVAGTIEVVSLTESASVGEACMRSLSTAPRLRDLDLSGCSAVSCAMLLGLVRHGNNGFRVGGPQSCVLNVTRCPLITSQCRQLIVNAWTSCHGSSACRRRIYPPP